jgi:glycosyltransferase involved in cell wall biosynthesis
MSSISVIVPSLNVAPYIQQCLDSIKNQTFQDLEIICVDAGSTDGTLEIIEENAASDRRIVVLHSDKKSYGYQVNIGMEHASGRYIGIVDSDDYIEPDMYNQLFSIMESSDYDYVKCNYIVHRPLKKGCIIEHLNFLSNVRYLAHIPLDYMNHSTSVYEHPELLLGETYIWNGLYRKSFLDVNHIRVNETQGAAWQDIGFSIHMLLCAHKIFITNQYFNHYRLGREGNSTDNPNKLNYIYQEWKRVLDEFPIPDNEQIKRHLYARMALQFTCVYTEVLELQNYEADSAYLNKYPWFKNILQQALQDYNLAELGEELYERLGLILYNPGLFAQCRKGLDEYKRESINDKLGQITHRNVIIFGSGIYGVDALKKMDPFDYNIDAFADNNRTKWGSECAGVPVISPEVCVRKYPDDSYLIANKMHYQEITEQLLELGIAGDHISYWCT